MSTGQRLRELRKERKLTVDRVAAAASLSKSYISQIENDKANPSLGTLQAIMNVLQLPLAALFEYSADRPRIAVVRKAERKADTLSGSKVRRYFLSPDAQKKMEAVLVSAQPGMISGPNPFAHDGEEFGMILRGKVKLRVGDTTLVLEEGDCVYFDCNMPHEWVCIGDGPAESIWVVTPPSF
jgi:transcriptional regulator with XRE-family HTH domain